MNKNSKLFILTIFILITAISSVNASSTNNPDQSNIIQELEKVTENYRPTNNSNHTLLSFNKNNTQDSYDPEKLDKSRPIYFAMDHTNANDQIICDNIVNRLKSEGFNVVSAEIGPNKMSQNTLYLYENNVSNAIVFHLFNGVDPSTIRELAANGDDNRGRIVRQRGNDVVLAWYYNSVDCVNDNGSGLSYIHGSETGGMLKNPREYMEENDIIAICTSSDMGRHKENADYTGEKTVEEFIKLFNN